MIGHLLLQLVLISLNAFFAAMEIAVISLNEKKIKARAEDGDKKANKLLNILKDPTKFLSTIQIGITLAGFLGSAFAADNFANKLSGFISNTFDVSTKSVGIINTVSVVLITLILSYFTLVFGELVPKRIAMRHKEKLANSMCGVISVLTVILKPFIWFLTVSTNGVLRLCGINPNEPDEAISQEDIVLMLDAGADEGTIDKQDIRYIKNVFKLDSMTAEDVMTPRTNIISISNTATDSEVMQMIEEEAYSRIPVHSGELDRITGVLYAREYLLKRNNPDFDISQSIKEPIFVPETKKLDVLFKEMQDSHNHMVVNEYGLTSGIVTMEDILEEIVGEIWDEVDEAVEPIKQQSDNLYLVDTSIYIDTLFDYFDVENPGDIESTTVNGWIIEKCGDIPNKDYFFEYDKLKITVIEVDAVQTQKILVEVKPTVEESTEN